MTDNSPYQTFHSLFESYYEYFQYREKSGQRTNPEQDMTSLKNYRDMMDIAIKESRDPGPGHELFKETFEKNWKWFQDEGIGLMHDELFPREEVVHLYSTLEDIGKATKSGSIYEDKNFVEELNYFNIHIKRTAIPADKITITNKQNHDAMESLKKLLSNALEKAERKADISSVEEETLRSDYERWLIYNYRCTKQQIEYILRKQVGNKEDRDQLLKYLRKIKEKVQQWVPLSYRIFGLPCGIDGGPLKDEKTDLTMMAEDIDLITRLFEERENKHQAIRGLSRTHLKDKNLQPNNPNFPASALFNKIEEVRELLASRYFSYINGSRYHDYRCSSLLTDRTGRFTGNGTVFIYITGHGLSSKLANSLARGLTSLEKTYPQYAGYLVAQPDHGRLSHEELLEAGQVVAFTKFMGVQDFIIEFLETCRTNQVTKHESPYFKPEPEPFQQRHLIIVVDACFSGNWIKDNLIDQFKVPYIEDTNISITIQTSTDKRLPSYGYFFTPLFVKLQTLDEKELNDLVENFNNTNEEFRNRFSTQLKERHEMKELPIPQFCHYRINEANRKLCRDDANKIKAYITVQDLRFFVDSNFFAFFTLKHMDDLLGPDIDRLLSRPLLDRDGGSQFLKRLTEEKTIQIHGMKLKRFRDGTPLCVVAVRSPINIFEGKHVLTHYDEYWYHLHVHFNGCNNTQIPFPGKITHIKIVYAVQSQLWYNEQGVYEGNTFADASRDNQNDYEQMETERASEDPNKINVEFFVDDWRRYHDKVKKCLSDWSQVQQTRKFLSKGKEREDYLIPTIWSSKKLWYELEPVQFGAVLVRHRSRCLITEQIEVSQVVDRVRCEFSEHKYLEYNPKEDKNEQEEQVTAGAVVIYNNDK